MTAAHDMLILIPAAGASRRMGAGDKCLEDVAGEPVLRRAARLALSTGARVLVSLPATGPRLAGRLAALVGLTAEVVILPDASEGMAASLRAGARAALEQAAPGMMILLPDMPEITEDDIGLLLSRFMLFPERPLRAASADGQPGHPVIFPARLLPELDGLRGDKGGRELLDRDQVILVPLAGQSAILDLDTPAEWAAWRARRA